MRSPVERKRDCLFKKRRKINDEEHHPRRAKDVGPSAQIEGSAPQETKSSSRSQGHTTEGDQIRDSDI